jgi:hypothetical protein
MRGDLGVDRWKSSTPIYKKLPYIAAKRLFVFLIYKGISLRPGRAVLPYGVEKFHLSTPKPHHAK